MSNVESLESSNLGDIVNYREFAYLAVSKKKQNIRRMLTSQVLRLLPKY